MPFLFIARKDDSADYCRGCHMQSYPSDFHMENWLDREKLVKLWAKYLQQNMNLRINESGYDFFIFKDGTKVWDTQICGGSYWDGAEQYGYNTDAYYEHYSELEAREAADNEEMAGIYAEALSEANKLQGAKITKEQEEKAREADKAAQKAKEDRRLQFEKLKQEFANENPPNA